jgi:hypothetical protein
MATGEPITLTRECDVVEIPSGTPNKLAAGDIVKIMQNLGSTYTVFNERGGMKQPQPRTEFSPSRWCGIS